MTDTNIPNMALERAKQLARDYIALHAKYEELEAEVERLRGALDLAVMLYGRTGNALTDFEEQSAVFERDTGKLRPGKDSAVPELAASYEEYRAWLVDKFEVMRDALKGEKL